MLVNEHYDPSVLLYVFIFKIGIIFGKVQCISQLSLHKSLYCMCCLCVLYCWVFMVLYSAFGGSKPRNDHSALNVKYDTAELALQKKWLKYCSRGDPLLFNRVMYVAYLCDK